MKYTFDTEYNQHALSAMAKCIYRTSRKSMHIRGIIAISLAVILSLVYTFWLATGYYAFDFYGILIYALLPYTVLIHIFRSQLSGYRSKKRLIKGTEKVHSTFDTENADFFVGEAAISKSDFSYETILFIAETPRYFVFVLSANHGQVYDKATLAGGTEAEFREFITAKTNKPIVYVK